jgi:hypothetical protein
MALDYGKYSLVNGRPGHIRVFIGQGISIKLRIGLRVGIVSIVGEGPEQHHNLSPGFQWDGNEPDRSRKACLLLPAAGISLFSEVYDQVSGDSYLVRGLSLPADENSLRRRNV